MRESPQRDAAGIVGYDDTSRKASP